MEQIRRWRAGMRARPTAVDAALAAVVFVLALGAAVSPPHSLPAPRHQVWTLVVVAASCAALAWRRRRPLGVLAVAVAGAAVLLVVSNATQPFVPALVIALYTVARYDRKRRAGGIAVLCCALLVAVSVAAAHAWVWHDTQTLLVIWPALATAVGIARRVQREQLESAEDRARRAEQTRDEEARRQVAEERLRIARDLHDIVAHQIALIGVQAGVAAQLLRSAPDAADTALGHVRTASRDVLTELGAMLNVLRRPDDDAPTEPTPGLERAPALFRSFEDAGLPLRVTVSGRPRPLPSAVGLTAYRVLQESLTNVQKHGNGSPAEIAMSWGRDVLQLDVSNALDGRDALDEPGQVGGAAAGTGGHGLLGMTERAQAVGGSLSAQRTRNGGFVVRAVLPAPAGDGPDGAAGRDGGDGEDPAAALARARQ